MNNNQNLEKKKKYECIKCNYVTNYKSSYDKHLSSNIHITGEKKVRSDKKDNKCEICNEIFASQQSLKDHKINKHTDIKNKKENYKYYCECCYIGTNTETIYKKHIESKKHQSIIKNVNFNTL